MTFIRRLPCLAALIAFVGSSPVSGRAAPAPLQGIARRPEAQAVPRAGGIMIADEGQVPVIEGSAPLDDPGAEGMEVDRANRVPTVEAVPRVGEPPAAEQPPPVQQPPTEP